MKFDPNQLDLDTAKSVVMGEVRSDEVPDVIAHHDFHERWKMLKPELEAELADGTYRPTPARLHEVPKSLLASRPIAVMQLGDRIVYEAVMQRIAGPIDAELSDEVHSARLKKSKRGWQSPRKQVNAWVKFQKAGRELCESYDDACMLTTDITSYFEFIDRRALLKQLNEIHGIDKTSAQFVVEFIKELSSTTNLHGVPQGPEISSVLGNIYLLPLDVALRKLDVKFLRFQDDIKIFADQPHELRLAMQNLMPIVRERHLNFSGAKTKLLTGSAVLQHFEDLDKDAIQYGIDTGSDVAADLRSLFDRAVADSHAVDERDVRFAVTRFRRLKDDHAVGWILENLPLVPYLASYLVRYLSEFSSSRADIEEVVRDYLADSRANIDPYMEMHLIRMLANSESIQDDTYDLLWTILKDQNKQSYVREFAARCVARHMDGSRAQDRALLRSLFQLTSNSAIKRALLVAEYECIGTPDKSWLKQVESANAELGHTCRYLGSGPSLPNP